MAIVSHEEAERYSTGGNGEWFQLKNDGDVARVQFMYDNYDEIQTITAHRVKVGDKERYVDCLRPHYDSPIDDCPFCAAGIPAKPVRFILMYQHDDGKVKIWERGKQFLTKLQGLFNRYNPLSEYVFEIERHGKPGDQKTTYDVYPMDRVDPVDLTDVEIPELMGGLVMQKNADEMDIYLDTGNFPDTENRAVTPERRTETRGASRRAPATQQQGTSRAPARSTPADNQGVRPRGSRVQAPAQAETAATSAPASRVGSRRGGPATSKDTEVF